MKPWRASDNKVYQRELVDAQLALSASMGGAFREGLEAVTLVWAQPA